MCLQLSYVQRRSPSQPTLRLMLAMRGSCTVWEHSPSPCISVHADLKSCCNAVLLRAFQGSISHLRFDCSVALTSAGLSPLFSACQGRGVRPSHVERLLPDGAGEDLTGPPDAAAELTDQRRCRAGQHRRLHVRLLPVALPWTKPWHAGQGDLAAVGDETCTPRRTLYSGQTTDFPRQRLWCPCERSCG